jgi:hypothetical protein
MPACLLKNHAASTLIPHIKAAPVSVLLSYFMKEMRGEIPKGGLFVCQPARWGCRDLRYEYLSVKSQITQCSGTRVNGGDRWFGCSWDVQMKCLYYTMCVCVCVRRLWKQLVKCAFTDKQKGGLVSCNHLVSDDNFCFSKWHDLAQGFVLEPVWNLKALCEEQRKEKEKERLRW